MSNNMSNYTDDDIDKLHGKLRSLIVTEKDKPDLLACVMASFEDEETGIVIPEEEKEKCRAKLILLEKKPRLSIDEYRGWFDGILHEAGLYCGGGYEDLDFSSPFAFASTKAEAEREQKVPDLKLCTTKRGYCTRVPLPDDPFYQLEMLLAVMEKKDDIKSTLDQVPVINKELNKKHEDDLKFRNLIGGLHKHDITAGREFMQRYGCDLYRLKAELLDKIKNGTDRYWFWLLDKRVEEQKKAGTY